MSKSMRVRAFILTFACMLVLAAAACGGDGGDGLGSASAEFAPANAAVFVAVDTDFESEQWSNARELVGRFPDGDRAVEFFLAELEKEGINFEEDLRPALGPEVGLVV